MRGVLARAYPWPSRAEGGRTCHGCRNPSASAYAPPARLRFALGLWSAAFVGRRCSPPVGVPARRSFDPSSRSSAPDGRREVARKGLRRAPSPTCGQAHERHAKTLHGLFAGVHRKSLKSAHPWGSRVNARVRRRQPSLPECHQAVENACHFLTCEVL
jgi:hypothetical protein